MSSSMRDGQKPAYIRPQIAAIGTQQIAAVSQLALGDPDVVAMWFGESDIPTPDFICQATMAALEKGETFYNHKRGIPDLRQAITRYMNGVHPHAKLDAERVTAMQSGMAAIMVALQSIIEPGDNAIIISPVWPNAQAAVRALGGEVRFCPLQAHDGRWSLDMAQLEALIDGRSRMIFVNSPNNPTGWVMPRAQQQAMLALARQHGLWIMSDEVYSRMVYDGGAAPSFLDIAEPDDPLLVVHSFSKSWAMTGWRLGWLVHPRYFGATLDIMIEYNYSCMPVFTQRGAITALDQGDDFIARMVDYCRVGRDMVAQYLPNLPRIAEYRTADASFYAFFRVDGVEDSLAFAQELVRQSKVGIAPGTAFGPGGEGGWFRMCFAQSPAKLRLGLERLEQGLRQITA